jgi:hypothetical protein
MTAYENQHGYVETFTAPWLWTLLFGPLYFIYKGIWTHAVAALILVLVTAGISHLFYPFFARAALEAHYERNGWRKVSDNYNGIRSPYEH